MATRYRQAPGITSTELDGQVMLLLADSEVVLHLNEVASDVWLLLDEESSLDELAEVLSRAYAVTADRVRDDVRPVLALLTEQGAVLTS